MEQSTAAAPEVNYCSLEIINSAAGATSPILAPEELSLASVPQHCLSVSSSASSSSEIPVGHLQGFISTHEIATGIKKMISNTLFPSS